MRPSDARPGWDRFEGGRNRNRDRTPPSVRTRRDSGAYGLVGPKEPGTVAVGGTGRGSGGFPVPVTVHPQAIDLSAVDGNLNRRPSFQVWSAGLEQLDAPTASGSGRLPVSATLLACLMTTVPTLWLGAMVALAVALRY